MMTWHPRKHIQLFELNDYLWCGDEYQVRACLGRHVKERLTAVTSDELRFSYFPPWINGRSRNPYHARVSFTLFWQSMSRTDDYFQQDVSLGGAKPDQQLKLVQFDMNQLYDRRISDVYDKQLQNALYQVIESSLYWCDYLRANIPYILTSYINTYFCMVDSATETIHISRTIRQSDISSHDNNYSVIEAICLLSRHTFNQMKQQAQKRAKVRSTAGTNTMTDDMDRPAGDNGIVLPQQRIAVKHELLQSRLPADLVEQVCQQHSFDTRYVERKQDAWFLFKCVYNGRPVIVKACEVESDEFGTICMDNEVVNERVSYNQCSRLQGVCIPTWRAHGTFMWLHDADLEPKEVPFMFGLVVDDVGEELTEADKMDHDVAMSALCSVTQMLQCHIYHYDLQPDYMRAVKRADGKTEVWITEFGSALPTAEADHDEYGMRCVINCAIYDLKFTFPSLEQYERGVEQPIDQKLYNWLCEQTWQTDEDTHQ